jgi:hypothetical protein
MRTLIFIFLIAFLANANTFAQVAENDQNPNYRSSMEKYMQRKDTLLQNMGETVQQTYKAIDPIADRREARLERKEDRRAFRRALRLERARRPQIINPRRRGWGWNNGGTTVGITVGTMAGITTVPLIRFSFPGADHKVQTHFSSIIVGLTKTGRGHSHFILSKQ